jgi:hypothetical protein
MTSKRAAILGARFSRSQEAALLDVLDLTPVTPTGLQEITDSGAIDLVTYKTDITTTGAAAMTLADGVEGQRKKVELVVHVGDATITPTNLNGYTTVVLSVVGDIVEFMFTGTGWSIVHMDSALGTGVTPVAA